VAITVIVCWPCPHEANILVMTPGRMHGDRSGIANLRGE